MGLAYLQEGYENLGLSQDTQIRKKTRKKMATRLAHIHLENGGYNSV